ncbi:MAG: Gfo/Idh/MocA family oxidoreductase [Alphaproteobacteria bacterium]|nr:Gfo/Idh/MocA family oxidoreductase [Alphaproteobacteria bacterium]
MVKILKVGVIGTGMIGQDHIRRITDLIPSAVVTAVTDTNADNAKQAARKAADIKIFETAEQLIAADNVDAVLICSWGGAHEAAILLALAAGKPIFCEKPLADSQAACQRIIEAEVKLGKRLLQVGYMRRYDPAYKAMKATIDSGKIGAPLIFHSVHRNAGVPDHYKGDMAISDTMVHDIDVARWLLDSEVARVRVVGAKKNTRGGGLRDPLMALIEMDNKTLASVEVSVNIDYGYDIQGEVSAEKGSVSLGETNKIIVKSQGQFSGEILADWMLRFVEAYDVEIAMWAEAARHGGVTGPSAWDGYAIQAVSDAAIKSADSGDVVELNIGDKPSIYV